MQMVSAARLKRAREALESSMIYSDAVRLAVKNVSKSGEAISDFADRIINGKTKDYMPTLIILFSSDKGLCGPFNQSIFKRLDADIDHHEHVKIMAIGKRAIDYVNAHYPEDLLAEYMFSELDDEKLSLIADEICSKIEANKISNCEIYYNHFKNVISNETIIKHLIPFTHDGEEEPQKVELEGENVLDKVLRLYILSELKNAANHSRASEESSRTTAMDNATKNAGELIDNLTLATNRKRQSLITGELIEIISGAEAV
jgi:F-type H+-transporting ATPase subunit gamma